MTRANKSQTALAECRVTLEQIQTLAFLAHSHITQPGETSDGATAARVLEVIQALSRSALEASK